MKTNIVLLATLTAMAFARAARAQEDADAGAPPVVITRPTAVAPVAVAPTTTTTTTTITMTREELEKLIDARIAAKAAPPNPTVGEGQKEVDKAPFGFGNFAWSPSNLGSSDRPLTW